MSKKVSTAPPKPYMWGYILYSNDGETVLEDCRSQHPLPDGIPSYTYIDDDTYPNGIYYLIADYPKELNYDLSDYLGISTEPFSSTPTISTNTQLLPDNFYYVVPKSTDRPTNISLTTVPMTTGKHLLSVKSKYSDYLDSSAVYTEYTKN